MKKQSTSLFEAISKKLNQTISGSVNESFASNIDTATNSRVFTAADLWNIQRKGISGLRRRSSL